MQFIQHYATLRCVKEIYFASVSNIDSVVAGTKNIPGTEAFILWLPGLQCALVPLQPLILHDTYTHIPIMDTLFFFRYQ